MSKVEGNEGDSIFFGGAGDDGRLDRWNIGVRMQVALD
jgi:hypothetical protein